MAIGSRRPPCPPPEAAGRFRRLPVALSATILLAGGCGGVAARKPLAKGAAAPVSSSRCPSAPPSGTCVFVLTDGRRFRCPAEGFAQSTPTLAALGRCARLRPLSVPAGARAVFAALGTVRACLKTRGLGVTGGPVFPPDPQIPDAPAGELVVGAAGGAAFVSFYASRDRARRLEPTVVRTARQSGGAAERSGSVTVVWVHQPPPDLLRDVRACAFPTGLRLGG